MTLSQSLAYRIERHATRILRGYEVARLRRVLGVTVDEEVPIEFYRMARTIKAYQPSINRLVDIGAHRGKFTQMASKVWQLSEVVCVEPNKDLAETLVRAIPSTAKYFCVALGEAEAKAAYYVHPDSSMNSLVPVDPEAFNGSFGYHKAENVVSRQVEVRTMDSLLLQLRDRSERDILLKVDAQGSEMAILRGGCATLALCSACIVEYMFWAGYQKTYDLSDLIAFMRDQGFRCAGSLEPVYRIDGRAATADMLFLSD